MNDELPVGGKKLVFTAHYPSFVVHYFLSPIDIRPPIAVAWAIRIYSTGPPFGTLLPWPFLNANIPILVAASAVRTIDSRRSSCKPARSVAGLRPRMWLAPTVANTWAELSWILRT